MWSYMLLNIWKENVVNKDQYTKYVYYLLIVIHFLASDRRTVFNKRSLILLIFLSNIDKEGYDITLHLLLLKYLI